MYIVSFFFVKCKGFSATGVNKPKFFSRPVILSLTCALQAGRWR